MGEFSVSFNDTFEQDLYPNANFIFVVKIHNNLSKIARVNARPSCSKCCLHTYVYMAMHGVACITYTYVFKNQMSNLCQLALLHMCDLIFENRPFMLIS